MTTSEISVGLNMAKLRRQLEAISRHASALAQELAEIDGEAAIAQFTVDNRSGTYTMPSASPQAGEPS